MSDSWLIDVRDVSKKFAGVHALRGVSLQLKAGEVLAVVGENGAGKSTLMKILAGVQQPTEGQVMVDGKSVTIESCRSAMNLGITLIHQELNLADNLDVGANIFLGREPTKFGLIDKAKIHRDAKQYLDMVGLELSPATLVKDLSIGKQQMVEIAKALSAGARVLIMDEPTSSLSSRETERLFELVKGLRRKGVSVIYISHRLGEVKELADRVCVLRDGENAGDLTTQEISHENLVRLMVGRDLSQFYAHEPQKPGEVVLEVQDLVTPAWPQQKLTFSVKAGEIVGVSGLVGAGRTEMLQVLFGVDPAVSGRIVLEGEQLSLSGPQAAIQSGIALVPEDRKQHGLVVDMSVRENISLAGLKRNQHFAGFLNNRREGADTREMTEKMRIKTPSGEQIARYLSGGNQQKVVIGKWLALGPKVLLLDEPTRGIDIGAKQEIYHLMEQLAEEGVAILFVSSEMEEILGMSDRVLVMHEGRLAGELSRTQLSEESIMNLATGGTLAESA
ncbi:MAG: sugar ABC transporter ATP-binding protein [Planctomycetota bacterium]|nr:sugar ABC transporter ATP-binding protein [Planctomycetota bacterium]